MKSLEEIGMLVKVGTSMVKEAKNSEKVKKAKADVKEDLASLKKSELPKKLVKDLAVRTKTTALMIKEVLTSDEAQFIKTAITESEQGKKISKNLETIKDMIPFPIIREYTNYKYWLINNGTVVKMVLSVNPVTLISYFLKYPWLFEYTKANMMVNSYQENRTGNNFFLMHEELKFVIQAQAYCITQAMNHPETTIYVQNVIATEIIAACGLNFQPVELGTLICKLSQWSIMPYLEAGEAVGLAADTCGLPKSSLGLALLGEILPAAAFMTTNYPCDGGIGSYHGMSELTGYPIYRMNMPYELRSEEAAEALIPELRNMIKWIEETTPGKMDWNKLKEICENYNKMAEIEYERWEMVKVDKPPMSNDAIQQCHYYNFSFLSALPFTLKHHTKMYEMNKKHIAKGTPCFEGMRYRVVMWNPAPSAYGQWYHWLEQCWGISILMDLETIGDMCHIDTSSEETMLFGLAKRHLWQTMAKHTKGPSTNYLNDLVTAIEGWRPDFILLPKPIGCKNVMSMEATIRDLCRKKDLPLCTFTMELQDNRVATRQQMRDEVNKFMIEIMHAEPTDPSLLKQDDSDETKW